MTSLNFRSARQRRSCVPYVATIPGGFTLIETMMVLAIMAVLIAIALPSFRDVIDRYRVRRTIEDLSATIYMARTEAIKRGGRVSIQKTTGAACSTTQEWTCGWTVFEDVNENGTLNATDTVLQSSLAPKGVYVMLFKGAGGGGPKSMTMNRWGSANGLGAFSFNVQPVNNPSIDLVMGLCMSSGGRLRTIKGAETCS